MVVGDGDPMLISEKLWQMAADFRHLGIKKIKGDIIIDNSLFDGSTWDISRASSKYASTNAYDAPVSALGVNFNTFPIVLTPGYSANSPAFMSIDPYPIRGIQIKNKVSTAKNTRINVKRTNIGSNVRVTSRGTISQGPIIKKLYRSVANPILTGGEQIRSFLKHENITIDGQVVAGKRPKDSRYLYKIQSYELSRMITGLNKYSNNYIADVLIKRLGASFYKGKDMHAGSLSAGMHILHSFMMDDVKVKPDFKLYNGSGLDTRNRLSASHVVKLLRYMYQSMDTFPEFLASLPASGWDGTLEDRFKGKRLKHLVGKVRAKTGTLTKPISVSSLAGYMGHPKHGMLAFAIIENGKKKRASEHTRSSRSPRNGPQHNNQTLLGEWFMDFEKRALEYHQREPAGKISTSITKPVETQDDLSIAYSPGVAGPCREIEKTKKTLFFIPGEQT